MKKVGCEFLKIVLNNCNRLSPQSKFSGQKLIAAVGFLYEVSLTGEIGHEIVKVSNLNANCSH